MPYLLILGAFTPYFEFQLDIRLEHLFAYPAAALLVANGRVTADRTMRIARSVLIPWLFLTALVTMSTGLRLTALTGSFPTVRLLAILDSFLLPVALVLVSGSFAAADPARWQRQMRRAVGCLVALISLNSLLIVVFTIDQVDGFVRQFWSNPATTVAGASVAELAFRGGRYGGIFNQPFDGGLAYALALMGWAYLFVLNRRSTLRRWVAGIGSLGLILVGGLSTGSKVFVYGTVMVIAGTLLLDAGAVRSRLSRAARGGVVALLGVVAVTASDFANFDRALRALGAFGSDAEAFSGGRWLSVGAYLGDVAASVSIAGQGWVGAQDDALIAYLRGGGIFGVIAIMAVFRALFLLPSRLPRRGIERVLIIGLTTIMLGASIGAISLQVNRASSIYWSFIGLAVGHVAKRGRRAPEQSAGSFGRSLVGRSQFAVAARPR